MAALAASTASRWLVAAVAVSIAAATGGWFAFGGQEPLTAAVEQVNDGDVSACTALSDALQQIRLEHPEGVAAPAGYDSAMARCIDHRIEQANAIPGDLERERAMLQVADPQAVLQPNADQLGRIDQLVAALPGALEDGKPRIRTRSYDMVGQLPIAPLRQLFRDYQLQLRACHAKAAAENSQLDRDLLLRLDIGSSGMVSAVSAVGASPGEPLLGCMQALFVGMQLKASAGGRATVELRLR